jgi:hypothetical protein
MEKPSQLEWQTSEEEEEGRWHERMAGGPEGKSRNEKSK